MSRKSASSNPFAPKLWKEAERLARKYQVLTWYDEEESAYFGQCMEIPGCISYGDTPAERDRMVLESMTLSVADSMEHGEPVPAPLSECARTTQINIRLSRKEKLILEHAAKAHGYHGVSDYVRAKAMSA
jgi:predicted RNase H-like HicB family nuclease